MSQRLQRAKRAWKRGASSRSIEQIAARYEQVRAARARGDLVGFSKRPDGTHLIIGIGPLSWLQARLVAGCELVTREVTAADLTEAPVERDLSGGSL